jgi:hypothetical protein
LPVVTATRVKHATATASVIRIIHPPPLMRLYVAVVQRGDSFML